MGNININAVLNAEIGGFSIGKIISAVVVFIICLFIKKMVLNVTDKLLKKSKFNGKVSGLIGKIINIILYFLIIMLTASTLGVNTSSLIALFTALSLGITLAMNDILSNFAGGLVMLSSKPFNIGDYISVGGVEGNVSEIRLSVTRIKTLDNQLISIPNKEMASSKIINYTAQPTRRCSYSVTASYDSPTDAVKTALIEAMTDEETVLKDPAPAAYLTNYGESSIEYTIYFWTKNADFLSAKLHIIERIRDKFDKYGISMDYNHVNVHMVQ